MPKGTGRPFDKGLKTIQNSKLYKGSGLAGELSRGKEANRNFGARSDFNQFRDREQPQKTIPLKTGPENPPPKKTGPFLSGAKRSDTFDFDLQRHLKGK